MFFKWDELVQNEIHGIRVLKKAEIIDGQYCIDGSKIPQMKSENTELREHI